MSNSQELEDRITRLHAQGLVDLHFDLPLDLYERRTQADLLASQFIPEFEQGGIGVVVCALYIEDRYLPEKALAVGLGQIARLYAEAEASGRCRVCRSWSEIQATRAAGEIALLISMEGVEP